VWGLDIFGVYAIIKVGKRKEEGINLFLLINIRKKRLAPCRRKITDWPCWFSL